MRPSVKEPLNQQLPLTSRTDRWLSRTLRVGVWTSTLLIAVGLFLALVRPESAQWEAQTSTSPGSLTNMLSSQRGQSSAILFAGLLVLMLTPFVRVVATMAAFASEKDWKFVAVALTVFLLLITELVLSFG